MTSLGGGIPDARCRRKRTAKVDRACDGTATCASRGSASRHIVYVLRTELAYNAEGVSFVLLNPSSAICGFQHVVHALKLCGQCLEVSTLDEG